MPNRFRFSKAAEHLLDECRMVLPGIQALFGFQLIAVFSPGFDQKLSLAEQRLHVFALALVAVAVAIVMTRLLLWSMVPLAAGITIDCALILGLVFDGVRVVILSSTLFAVFFILWVLLPRVGALQRALGGRAASARLGGPSSECQKKDLTARDSKPHRPGQRDDCTWSSR